MALYQVADMLLAAYSTLVSRTKAPQSTSASSQSQSGLNTLSQRVLRKEATTPSAAVLMSRPNGQPAGNWAKDRTV